MLDTNALVDRLIEQGLTHVCAVPCSYAKPLINALINQSPKINYIPCASEAIACSVAAGLVMSGSKPFILSQSSGLTNMGSCISSLLKPYNIFVPILISWRPYTPGDSEIQHELLASTLPNLVSSYGYGLAILDSDNIGMACSQIHDSYLTHTLIVFRDKTFGEVDLANADCQIPGSVPKRTQYLEELNNHPLDPALTYIATTGALCRESAEYLSHKSVFFMAGNMGGALSLGLGSFLSGNRTIVLGGDAEFVMHLGGLTTAGRYNTGPGCLAYIVFDNEANKSTGGQKTYQNHVDYLALAKAAGFSIHPKVVADLKEFQAVIESLKGLEGLLFVHVKASFDGDVPRPKKKVVIDSKQAFNAQRLAP